MLAPYGQNAGQQLDARDVAGGRSPGWRGGIDRWSGIGPGVRSGDHGPDADAVGHFDFGVGRAVVGNGHSGSSAFDSFDGPWVGGAVCLAGGAWASEACLSLDGGWAAGQRSELGRFGCGLVAGISGAGGHSTSRAVVAAGGGPVDRQVLGRGLWHDGRRSLEVGGGAVQSPRDPVCF